MDKKSLLHPICHLAAATLLAVTTLLAACSSDHDPVSTDDSTDDTSSVTTTTGCMRITMNPTATRSLTYDGVTTTMDDGTLIGCVITSGDTSSGAEYYATAAWQYNSSTHTLTISRWWTYGDDTWTLHTATESSTSDALSYDSSGYTWINTEDYLYFYFYYPYIDPVNFEGNDSESSIAEYVPQADDSSYLMGMPVGESMASSGSTISSYTSNGGTVNLTTALPVFSWKQFPVFINQDQSEQGSINMSDFLYDAYEVGVNNETVDKATITLSKKTAAIRVMSSESLGNVKLINGSGDAITLGRYVNLYDGDETTIGSSDTYYSSSYLGTGGSISAYTISEGLYRFILPAQSNWCGKLSYSHEDDDDSSDDDSSTDDTSSTYSLSLADFGDGQLVNGTLYTVSVLPKENIYCYWNNKITTTDTTPVTSYIQTNVDDVFSYGSLDGSSASVQAFSTSVTVDGTTYNYYLKFDSHAFLQIAVPLSGMKLKIYYQTKDTSSTFTLKYYTYDNGTAGSADTKTLEAVGTDSSTSYGTAEITLNKGTYRIVRGSGESYVFYVLLSYPESS